MDFINSLPILLSQQDDNIPNVKQAVIGLAASYALWRIVRKWLIKHPLDKIPGPKSSSYISGYLFDLFNPDALDAHDSLGRNYPGIARVPTLMGNVMLYVYDPKALHHIMVKDQHIFEESDDFLRFNKVVFGHGLLATLGEHHRKQRKMLNPVFSIAHMREMIPIFYGISYKLRDAIRSEVSNGKTEIDMLSWFTRTALELIGQSGLGTSFDRLESDSQPHPYFESIKNLIRSLSIPRFIIFPHVANIGTPRFRRFVVDLLPWKNLHALRDMVDVMANTSVEIFESKKRAFELGDEAIHEQVGQGKDIISILLKANMLASEEDKLPDNELIAQISSLTFAAMDTTSNALSRILHTLCEHPEAQDRLRQEILQAREEHGELSYDELNNLTFLDAVCRETLRLYPPAPMVMRQARKDAILPLARPITTLDGRQITEVVVPEGTQILVSILSCNKNPLVWGPDADEWKPERWLSSLPASVTDARIPGVYSHLMTFIGGNRACIGFKFSQLEMKIVLCTLLESFKFTGTDKKIKWKFNGITQPAVEGSGSSENELPLNVSLIA
ncbi:cytochrome P450 [Coprinopsis marcescibilis]|uniref:Cytochrome P450 n=1 Tax=Coprinopsis marcescibilis TaxID=230819 RepID=A0A5C3L283_COPMA|nr:cytochrome P450 [Coprinopsis marcescibilis]